MPKSITVDRVSKTYGNGEEAVHVLDDISISIPEKEFVCILGPSGCGKTTLMKMMDGLVDPSEGEIRIGDTVITEPTPEAALVFQNFELFPWRTTLENVELGLEILGVDKSTRRERAQTWIDRVGLDGFEESYPSELSGGMQQRVGLARALCVDPEVILMDEPFGALDAQTKDKMQTQLLQLWEQEKKTVVFVTHDIRESIFLADRVLVMGTKPSSIVEDIEIPFERPRWKRRVEIENDDRFADIEQLLRERLGLKAEEETEVAQ
ncbi:ABC transporter ATP-binding protein [Natrarchaeobius halalkaliphilus]|uniref:Molybdate/tungstate import ATP-binding protein WtpC n=1 Tax=Natrarchaeobius halalkaliphilus TaxID=1679091 RepID=A0A3N6MT22_9EURY|nr:ABC transporter ATP-binding protein [Natrarchaeobius halalkaliphilus]RQG87925.1 ABC transporter ATP-binding protein [Natrarchaeobius halalkaliphilus]